MEADRERRHRRIIVNRLRATYDHLRKEVTTKFLLFALSKIDEKELEEIAQANLTGYLFKQAVLRKVG